MDDLNWDLPPELEDAIKRHYAAPEPTPAFAAKLNERLNRRQSELIQAEDQTRPLAFLKKKETQMNPKLKLAWTVALALLAFLLISGVAYAIGKLNGYIPGVGIIDQSAPLRVLAQPATITRDGVTVTITKAVLSADKTVLFVKVDGVPMEAYPVNESTDGTGCPGDASLQLANGTLLEGGKIGAGGWTHFEGRLEYAAIPAQVNDAILKFDCIGFTAPGALPENWQIPVHFAPAPPDMTVEPVIELSTPTARITPPATNPAIPTEGATSTPILSNTMTLNDITFTLEKFVAVEGGYQLYGNFDLSQLSVPPPGYFNVRGLLTLTDANGHRIPFEAVQSQSQSGSSDNSKIEWIYRTNQSAFAGPLVLSLPSVTGDVMPFIPFELDLGAAPQIGQTWQINRDLAFAEHNVRLLSAQLKKSDDPAWASLIEFTYEDKEGVTFITVSDDVPQEPLVESDYSPEFVDNSAAKIRVVSMAYAEIPSGLRHFTIDARVPHSIRGPWLVAWNPPTTTEPVPTYAPEACLTDEKWDQVKGQVGTIPSGLSGKIIYSTEAVIPNINIFLANLDGSDSRGLVSGGYPALSPDGTQLAFMSADVSLTILELSTGQTNSLGTGTTPVWSPDGSRIMFNNTTDGLYVINVDGSGKQKVRTNSVSAEAIGWLPDNQTVVVGAQVGDIYNQYEHVFQTYNLRSGEIKPLFQIGIKTPIGAISPDGQWIAFNDRVFGANYDGVLFISRLDGSERKRVGMLDNALVFHPRWSQDGQWLMASVMEADATRMVAINPFTCQAARLNNINGLIESWRP